MSVLPLVVHYWMPPRRQLALNVSAPQEDRKVRFSVSVPEDLRNRLDEISRVLGVTRSALVEQVLRDEIDRIHNRIFVHGSDTPELRDEKVRSRGRSSTLVRERVKNARRGKVGE